jgi:hypothetical protein
VPGCVVALRGLAHDLYGSARVPGLRATANASAARAAGFERFQHPSFDPELLTRHADIVETIAERPTKSIRYFLTQASTAKAHCSPAVNNPPVGP